MYEVLISFSVSCGAPSFASGVDVEPVTNTTVGSEIVYQCQSGFLPEGKMTSVCGGDGRWNPDPATLICNGTIYYWAAKHRLTSSKDNISFSYFASSFWVDSKTFHIMQQIVELQDLQEMELL